MFSENTTYVKLDEKNESTQTEENPAITPLAEPSVEENLAHEEIPTEELKDEHEQYLIKDPEDHQQTQEDAPLDETKQSEPITPILDSTAETAANKCVMTCSVM